VAPTDSSESNRSRSVAEQHVHQVDGTPSDTALDRPAIGINATDRGADIEKPVETTDIGQIKHSMEKHQLRRCRTRYSKNYIGSAQWQ